jgi:hypothetical protein
MENYKRRYDLEERTCKVWRRRLLGLPMRIPEN